jgi:hypothetical protein
MSFLLTVLNNTLTKQNVSILKKHITIYIIFSMIYYFVCYMSNNESFTKDDMTIGDAFYYGCTTHTTLGFGDISPISPFAKFCTVLHSVTVFFIVLS